MLSYISVQLAEVSTAEKLNFIMFALVVWPVLKGTMLRVRHLGHVFHDTECPNCKSFWTHRLLKATYRALCWLRCQTRNLSRHEFVEGLLQVWYFGGILAFIVTAILVKLEVVGATAFIVSFLSWTGGALFLVGLAFWFEPAKVNAATNAEDKVSIHVQDSEIG
jgi:hypothetical protein